MKPLPILAVLGILSVSAFMFLSRGTKDEYPSVQAVAEEAAPLLSTETVAAYQPLDMLQIFKIPAGPAGLEFSERASSLAGKQVRIEGQMVRHAHADPLLFLFTPNAMVLNQSEFGIADDFPPYGLHVITTPPPGKAANYQREKMILLGTLELGPRTEADGRISHVRLKLDHALDAETRRPIQLYASLAMQPERLLNANRTSTGSMP
ncbi:MAG: hypothetical protein EOP88_25450 [Verrucomicrobiaceae bacterium]|nr:MAG: hypothetical protein EOP88_25450 [Verrucomicrobiaceae bacterium]